MCANCDDLFTKEDLNRLYWDEGLNQVQIGDRYGVSFMTVSKNMKRLGVPVRSVSVRCSHPKYSYDHNFFKSVTHESAYVFGCLFSDGCICDNGGSIYVDLSSVDFDWLELVRGLMESDHKIVSGCKSSGSYGSRVCYKFRICVRELLDDLYSLGMTRAKSQVVQFPDIPIEYVPDFIRGYHDGNGSFFVDSRGRLVSSVSSTRSFLDVYCYKLKSLGMKFDSSPFMHSNKSSKIWNKVFTGSKAIEFAKVIYYDESVPRMIRKYEIARKFM